MAKHFLFLIVLAAILFAQGCSLPVDNPGGSHEFPAHCAAVAHRHFLVDQRRGDVVRMFKAAADAWSKRTDGCVHLEVEEAPLVDVENALCVDDTLFIASERSGFDEEFPTEEGVLGTTAACRGSGKARIVMYEKSIGTSEDYFLIVLDHELGHSVGFGHTGELGCVMYRAAARDAKWCEADQKECEELGLCL